MCAPALQDNLAVLERAGANRGIALHVGAEARSNIVQAVVAALTVLPMPLATHPQDRVLVLHRTLRRGVQRLLLLNGVSYPLMPVYSGCSRLGRGQAFV